MKPSRCAAYALPLLLATTAWPAVVSAQGLTNALALPSSGAGNFARDRNVSVRQRSRPEYEAPGIRAGAFILSPTVAATVYRTDNVYATEQGQVDDTVLNVGGGFNLRPTWSRHDLQVFAGGDATRYSDFDTEDTENWYVGGSGRLDLTRSSSLGGSLQYQRQTEARSSSPAAVSLAEPVQYDRTEATVQYGQVFNRVRLLAEGRIIELDFDSAEDFNGLEVSQDYRDRRTEILSLRGDYAISPATAIFLEVQGNRRSYDLSPPATALDRDSEGYLALVGANFELTNLIRGEVGVGYMSQDYEDVAYSDVDGFGARGELEWFPSQLTTVTISAARSIEDSSILGAAGYTNTSGSFRVDHELRRNVLLFGDVYLANQDYLGLAREDDRNGYRLGMQYLLNRNVDFNLSLERLEQDSSGQFRGPSYEINNISAAVALRF